MSAVIRYTGDPYLAQRAIERALKGRGWTVVVWHAVNEIHIAPAGTPPLNDVGVLVLCAGEQVEIGDSGGLRIGPIPAGAAP